MAVLALFFGIFPANAADTVGIIDSQKVMFQHPQFAAVTHLLLNLTRRPVQPDLQKELLEWAKGDAASTSSRLIFMENTRLIDEFVEMDRRYAQEQDPEKKHQMDIDRQTKLSEAEARLMPSIVKECQEAFRAVMTAKKMTVLLEKDPVYLGGTDITDDVIQQLKKMK